MQSDIPVREREREREIEKQTDRQTGREIYELFLGNDQGMKLLANFRRRCY